MVLLQVDCDYCLDGKKKTTRIQQNDALSAYNGGKFNFPWPTEHKISCPECACSSDDPVPLIMC